MLFSEFVKKGGRINLSVFPNGVVTEKGITSCAFSILLGFNVTKKSPRINKLDPKILLESVGQYINSIKAGITLSCNNGVQIISPITSDFFSPDQIKNIKGLFTTSNYYIDEGESQILLEIAGTQSNNEEDPPPPVQFFRITDPELFKTRHPLQMATSKSKKGVSVLSWDEEINNNIWERKVIYDSIHNKGIQVAASFSKIRKEKEQAEIDEKDLMAVLGTIYQHPRMARHFGLLYDFYIDVTADFCNEYLKASDDLRELKLIVNPPSNDYISETIKCNNTEIAVKDIIKVRAAKFTKGARTKYYHGPANFGLVPYKPNGENHVEWLTCNPDHHIRSQKMFTEASLAAQEEGKTIDFSDIKVPPLEGLYLVYMGENPTYQKTDCEWGLLGHNIVVAKDDKLPDNLFSLCSRKIDYTPKTGRPVNNYFEEGWVQIGSTMAGINQQFESNTIFHWTGDNLCIKKGVETVDQQLGNDEARDKGALAGLSENDELEIIRDFGFDFTYKHNAQSEVQFVCDTKYHFLIRMVLGNGHVMPLKTIAGRESELTVSDLVSGIAGPTVDAVNWYSYEGFTFDEQPVNAPVMLSSKVYLGEKDTESITHIVIKDNEAKTNSRWVFPPALNLMQARYFGVFTNKMLGKMSNGNFVNKAVSVALRSSKTLLTEQPILTNDVDYLADIRGDSLCLSPSDWFTNNLFSELVGNPCSVYSNFFNYTKLYELVKAGKCRLQKHDTKAFDIKASENTIDFYLKQGLQMHLNLQVHESDLMQLKSPTWMIPTQLKNNLLIHDCNHPKYMKMGFHLTHAVSTPPVPTFPSKIVVERPSKPDDAAKIFYEFSMPGYNTYAVKSFDLLSEYTRLLDDGMKLPDDQAIRTAIDGWNKKYPDTLLENEVPSSVFNETVSKITEPGVYKNRFGFSFKFNGNIEGVLAKDDEMIHLSFGNKIYIKILYASPNNASLILGDGNFASAPFPIKYTYSDLSKIICNYSIKVSSGKRKLTLTLENEEGVVIDPEDKDKKKYSEFPDSPQLPHPDLHYNHITLNPKLEQALLAEAAGNVKLNFVHEDKYFVYRQEATTDYLFKKSQLRAMSRFEEHFPAKAKSEFISVTVNQAETVLPNNKPPATPIFSITPLLYHEKSKTEHKRSMMLMFEIDRPLRNNEKFAIILSKSDGLQQKLTKETSAIGRDFTTFGLNIVKEYTEFGKPLIDFIDINPAPYLKKYFLEKDTIDSVNGYRILILDPFYEYKKNKWIAVISLDQKLLRTTKVTGGELNAYNPFVKIIAATYNSGSTTDNIISDFSLPKYINLLTERIIKVAVSNNKGKKSWNVKIMNFNQRKFDNTEPGSLPRTRFVIAIRKQPNNGMNQVIVPSSEVASGGMLATPKTFHVMQGDSIKIDFKAGMLICVYEFELFDNTIIDETSADWLNEPGVRMIYAEQF